MIAKIVSLSGYETEVSVLVEEDERRAMEFAIACARRISGYRVYFFLSILDGLKSQKKTLSAAGKNTLRRLAAQIK